MKPNTSINNIFALLMIAIFVFSGCATFKGKPQANEDPFDMKINSEADKTISILSEQIYSSMQEQKKRKIAVMNFSSPTGEITELDVFLSDKLTNFELKKY